MSENRPALSATSDMRPAPVPEPEPQPAPTPTPPPTSTASVPIVQPPSVTPPATEHQPIAERFSQLAAQRREAEARAERLERAATESNARLERALTALERLQTQQPTPTPTPTGTESLSPRPVRDSFVDPESYDAALISWATSAAAAELRQRQEADAAARAEAERVANETRARELREAEEAKRADESRVAWETRRAKALETHPDFSDVAEAPSLPLSLAMVHLIVSRDDGPEIAYYLGKNPQEAARIAALTVPGQVFPAGHPQAGLPVPNAVEQAYELGKIGARIAGLSPAVVPPVSGPVVENPPVVVLPAPPSPVTGLAAAATRRDPTEMSMDEYAAHRNAAIREERMPRRTH